ncbi:hypothetical protein D3C84_1068630 [compost metagenome]
MSELIHRRASGGGDGVRHVGCLLPCDVHQHQRIGVLVDIPDQCPEFIAILSLNFGSSWFAGNGTVQWAEGKSSEQ